MLAAAIVALTRDLWRETTLGRYGYAKLLTRIPRALQRSRNLLSEGEEATVLYLLRRLERDQSRRGPHRGEFGFHADMGEEVLFNPRIRDLLAKPRLYLTGWPCFVLVELGIGQRLLGRAVDAMQQHLSAGPMLVRATRAVHPESEATSASIRHTIRAVQIVHCALPNHQLITEIVGLMTDPLLRWQRSDGGWAQYDSDEGSDLWATAYAVAFLHRVTARWEQQGMRVGQQCIRALDGGLRYLAAEWTRTEWTYADAPSALNGMQIFHEVCDAIKCRAPELFGSTSAWVRAWVTEAGTLSASYRAACHVISDASANARVAYGLFLIAPDDGAWRPLFESALRHYRDSMNAADVAFLLHMSRGNLRRRNETRQGL